MGHVAPNRVEPGPGLPPLCLISLCEPPEEDGEVSDPRGRGRLWKSIAEHYRPHPEHALMTLFRRPSGRGAPRDEPVRGVINPGSA